MSSLPATVVNPAVKREAKPCKYTFTLPGTGSGAMELMVSGIDHDNLRNLNFYGDSVVSNNNLIKDTIRSKVNGMPVPFRPPSSRFFQIPVQRSSIIGDIKTEIIMVEVTVDGEIVFHRLSASAPFQPLETLTFYDSQGQYFT
jgi:hypothetical protein